MADWNGDGKTELGLYRPSSGEWFLDTDGDHVWRTCEHDMCVESFGSPGDMPVAGDWNGTGSAKIGVFRAETGEWFLDLNRNFKWDGPSVDLHVRGYGQARDLPVAGYW